MIEQGQTMARRWARRWWQAAFALLLTATLLFGASPELTAAALYRIGGVAAVAADDTERVEAAYVVAAGAAAGEADLPVQAGEKVTIRQGGEARYATGREGETVSALLRREGIRLGALERVYAERGDAGLVLELASDFTYYETVAEAAAYATTYVTDYTLPKGEEKVVKKGVTGTRDVTYEVIYADGERVSRQAVAEGESSAAAELVHVGTLVKEARAGDTIASVVTNADGSGYLLLKSGDSLRFTGSMAVKCTAYSAEQPTVGTRTATGTAVHVGVVAVDRKVIPLGTSMFITTADGAYTYGMGHAEDTGVRGNVVDLYMDTVYECRQFGRRNSVVYFLEQ